MKLMTNLFIGKKPSLEEGQMIYQIENDEAIVNHVERHKNCRRCMKLTRVLFYLALVLFVFFVVWFGSIFLGQYLADEKWRSTCGTSFLPDYEEVIRDRIRDDSATDLSGISEEDIVLKILGDAAINKFTERETSTMSDAEGNAILDDISDTMKVLVTAG